MSILRSNPLCISQLARLFLRATLSKIPHAPEVNALKRLFFLYHRYTKKLSNQILFRDFNLSFQRFWTQLTLFLSEKSFKCLT